MAALLPYLYVIIGLTLLTFGADYLIRGAVAIANRFSISPLVIGLTVVALGTSLPELVVCVRAALTGASGLAVGNVVGSNIANILLILGAAAVIFPVTSQRHHFLRDSAILGATTLICMAALATGTLVAWQGIIMVVLLIAFLLFSYQQGRKHGADDLSLIDLEEAEQPEAAPMGLSTAWVVGGLVGLALGAEFLVNGSTTIARALGVSEEVIGLTMVAIGTSLPELATVIAAAVKKHTDVVLGNVMGSNIFNVLGVMGATAIVADIPVAPQVIRLDMWIMAAATVLLTVMMLTGNRLNRLEGAVFLVLYLAYVGFQYTGMAPAA